MSIGIGLGLVAQAALIGEARVLTPTWTLLSENSGVAAAGAGTTSIPIENASEGDVVVVAIACDDTIPSINTSGYTAIYETGDIEPGGGVYYKIMGSNPDEEVIINQVAQETAAILQVWRKPDGVTPIDAAATSVTATGGNANPPSYTTVTDGALVFGVGFYDDDDFESTVVAPSGFTNLIAKDSGTASTSTGVTVFMASQILATAGVIDPGAFTDSAAGAIDRNRACTFALRPGF